MRRPVVALTFLLMMGLALHAPAQPAPSPDVPLPVAPQPDATANSADDPGGSRPVFKTSIELVGLNVTVTDGRQKYITGLSQSDFQVFEDGVQQDVSFFAASKVPLDLALLLDTSASMGDKISTVQEAAVGFIHHVHPGDRVAIIDFNNTVRVVEPFTDDVARLEAAIRRMRGQGGTALHNAVYVALKEFAKQLKQGNEVRRPAIVVLSDGEDTSSLINFDDVLDLAKRSGVSIYTIALKSRYEARQVQNTPGPRYYSQADFEMRSLAQETGGRSFFPLEISELRDVYGAIADELSAQYSLGYASKNVRRDGAFRRVIVRLLSRPDARLRTRTGYFAQRVSSALSAIGKE